MAGSSLSKDNFLVFLTLKMGKTRLSWSTTTTGLAASASLISSVISENTFTVNYMMSKESVKKRIETGISYTEFAYQIMQGYDFFVLNQDHNVTLQIGGSDQWGNMTAGTELLRRKADKTGHVITVPLITDATGKKFGKSEGNAVWLNPEKTSPYEMYQFWMNVMDADAVRFLKIFTFLSLDEIEDIRKQFEAAPHERLAQKSWLVKSLPCSRRRSLQRSP